MRKLEEQGEILCFSSFFTFNVRACLKNHSSNLHAPLCGIFHPNSVAVARYGALIRAKSSTSCDEHLAESLFQTCSGKPDKSMLQCKAKEG